MTAELNIGFLPLTDAAALIASADFEFAESQGLRLNLHRDVSWANLRDKLMVGQYDAAHMLAPLALAATLGIGQAKCSLRAPFLLNQNGNGITVSLRLMEEMNARHFDPLADWKSAANGIAACAAGRRDRGEEPLTLATVHLFSTHTYLLRHFLSAGGLNPDRDVELVVVPPPFMVDFMERGLIDAFCVGSPWNSIAVDQGKGALVALGCEVLENAPEKVLAMPEHLLPARKDDYESLMRALAAASAWVADPRHHAQLASAMARPDRLDCSAAVIERTLSGSLVLDGTGRARHRPDFVRFSGAGLPSPEACGPWLVAEMSAAGQLSDGNLARETAAQVFRSI